MSCMKVHNGMAAKGESPGSEGVRYATGEEYRNSFRKNEEAEPKQKEHTLVNVSGGESKV